MPTRTARTSSSAALVSLLLLSCEGTGGLAAAVAPLPGGDPETPALDRQAQILPLISRDRRQFESATPGVWAAHIPGVLRAELTEAGLQARSGLDEVGLRTVAVAGNPMGRSEPAEGGCAPGDETVGASCVRQIEMDHGAVTEWWVSRADGLEHGWTLHEAVGDGPARIAVDVGPGLLRSVDHDGQGAWLEGSAGGLWRYDGLVAWDADGVAVSAWLAAEAGQLLVHVATDGVRWPVTVDPLLGPGALRGQTVLASDAASSDLFGYSIDGAGDVNGDGFDDLVVGAPYNDDGGASSGSAYVYYGSATGISNLSESILTASDAAEGDQFGISVGGARDLNGDGYADVAVGAYRDDDGGTNSGAAYVYFGSASGVLVGSEEKLTASDASSDARLGTSLAGAGDLDGDGYDDLVVGAYSDDTSASNAGAAYVYYGSASGMDPTREDKLAPSGLASGDEFGASVGGAGDVDGDGFDDLVIGAANDDDNGSNSGAAYIYYGSASGVDTSAATKLTASDGGASDDFGQSVAGAGDVDGDGFDDVAIGATGDDDGTGDSGAVYVYYGSTAGLDAGSEQKLIASDPGSTDRFGGSVAGAGDVNGDGVDDLVVGSYLDDDNGTNSGSAYLYYGSTSGIDEATERKLTPSDGSNDDRFAFTVAGVGDLDGDGIIDFAGSVYRDDLAGTYSGSVRVFSLGAAAGASDADAGDAYGYSVAAAGDIDGDGFDDVVVGADHDDDNGSNSGAAYVYYGSAAGLDITTEHKLGASDAGADDLFGICVAGAGDVDGDGYDDLIVGAHQDDDNGSESGSAYVYYGSASGIDGSREDKLTASDGAADDLYGRQVSGLEDVDGDGYDDVVVGAHRDDDDGSNSGSAYVYYGSASGIDGSREDKLTASDAAAGDVFGISVASAGDVDTDGHGDLVVGAYLDDDGGSASGSAYVYYGSTSGIDASREDKLTASDAASADRFGRSVAGARDVDGDGYDDLVVGASLDDDSASGSGSAYVYYGSASGIDPGREDKLTASDGAADDNFGYRVAGARDIDGDGYDDVWVGAHLDDDSGSASGSAYLYYGSASGISTRFETKVGAPDGAADDQFGFGLAGAGDVDGDGFGDLVVGAYGSDVRGAGAGAVYVFRGGCRDADGDGYCTSDGDCDDGDATVHPGATDLTGDSVDQDCDGVERCYVDADDDGYTVGSATVLSADTDCTDAGEGASTDPSGDCDDTDAAFNPGAVDTVGDEVDHDCDGAEVCYADADDDGYIDLSVTVVSTDTDCSDSGEGVATDISGECDDTDGTINPGSAEFPGDGIDHDCDGTEICYADADDDGYIESVGSTPSTVTSADTDCADAGEALVTEPTGDCDDADASTHPGATEVVGDEVDQDCDDTEVCYADADDDGYTDGSTTVASSDSDCSDSGEGTSSDPTGECDDADASFNPGAADAVGDGIDHDCDGGELCYADADDDGYIDGSTTVSSSDPDCADSGEGTTLDLTGECDDTDAAINPAASELAGDEVDQDCDGTEYCYDDGDDDGYTDGSTIVVSLDTDCTDAGEGLSSDPTGECDDGDAAIHPGATEVVGDEVDQDCDGAETCYADADDDGYTDTSLTVSSVDVDCADSGEGAATDADGDCDDADASIHPGATEVVGDEVDQDCDGAESCYADADDDGYTDTAVTVSSADLDCTDSGEGAAADADGDCDDADASIHPGATEGVGDEVDQDCDGAETCYADADGDGYTDTSLTVSSADVDCADSGEGAATDADGDCDDDAAAYNPGAVEDDCSDPNDYNCDGSVAYADADADGWVACEECDDSDPAVNPEADEVCDGIDNDCDGTTDGADALDAATWYADEDGDGFGDPESAASACERPDGATADATDCDDTDPETFPGAPEIEDDGIDQDCDGSDLEGSGGGDSGTGGGDDGGEGGDGGDDGTADADDKADSTGCASVATSTAPGLVALLGMALAGLRRRERSQASRPGSSGAPAQGA